MAVLAPQIVLAVFASYGVVPGIADQSVVVRRTINPLESLYRVPSRMPAVARSKRASCRQRHRHPNVRRPVGHCIVARAAIQLVRLRAALDPVVAVPAAQRVPAAIPIQVVVVRAARQTVVVVIPSPNRHGCSSISRRFMQSGSREFAESRAGRPSRGRTALERADRWRGRPPERPRRQAGAPPAPAGENASLARRWNL